MYVFRRPYDYSIHRRHPVWTVLSAEQYNLAFFRFADVTVGNAETVVSCYVKFTAYENGSNDSHLKLAFVNADDQAAPTDEAELKALIPSLTAEISWSPGYWAAGMEYSTPELKTALQPVINRGGWASGQALVLVVKCFGSTGSRKISAIDYDSGSQKAELYIWAE
jgi:hypothetical protein